MRSVCVLYWIDSDYEGASRELTRAAALAPNDSEIQLIAAAILRRQGKWSEALAAFERAQQLDPQNPNVVRTFLSPHGNATLVRSKPELSARFRAISPDSMIAKIQSAYVAFVGYGM
jgi:tetratricopeptide (TPR) repeat protein